MPTASAADIFSTTAAGDGLVTAAEITDSTAPGRSLLKAVDTQSARETLGLEQAEIFIGNWDASAGTFPGGLETRAGFDYRCSVAGIVNSISFGVDDRLLARVDNPHTLLYSGYWNHTPNARTRLLTVTAPTNLDAIRNRINALDQSVILIGNWDASTGVFPGGGTAQAGHQFRCSVAGTVDGRLYAVDDIIEAFIDNASTTTFAGNWMRASSVSATLTIWPPSQSAVLAVGSSYAYSFTVSGGTGPYVWSVPAQDLPPGLILSSVGFFSGTLTTTGTYAATVTVTDSLGTTGTASYVWTVVVGASALSITPASQSANLSVGQTFAYNFSTSGGAGPYTYEKIAGSFPPGLALTGAGFFSGTLTTAGTYSATVRSTDTQGRVGTAAYTWIVSASILSITPASQTATGLAVGQTYGYNFSTTGGTAPYAYAVTVGVFPPGLTLSSAGYLSGTLTTAGDWTATVTVTDSVGRTGTASYAWLVVAAVAGLAIVPPSQTANPALVIGQSYSYYLIATGGTGPYTWAVISGALLPGMTLSSGGLFSGTLTTAGRFTATVRATDSLGKIGTATYVWPVVATSSGLLNAQPSTLALTQGVAVNYTPSVTGGTGPYSHSLTAGVLPNGLSLNATTGQITGTPVTAGGFAFTVTVTDSLAVSDTIHYAGTIATEGLPLAIASNNIINPTIGTPLSQQFRASGGVAPYTWTAPSGATTLPLGLVMSSGGLLSGTPTRGGDYAFSIRVTDSLGAIASQPFVGTVAASGSYLLLETKLVATFDVTGNVGGWLFSASGSTGPYVYRVKAGALPAGCSVTPGGLVIFHLVEAGSGSVTIEAKSATNALVENTFAWTTINSGSVFGLKITPDGSTAAAFGASTLPTMTRHAAWSQQFTATGVGGAISPPVTWTLQSAPGGLSINGTGLVTGTIGSAVGTTGTFVVQAQDLHGAYAGGILEIPYTVVAGSGAGFDFSDTLPKFDSTSASPFTFDGA